jgi:hypothetical protein
LFTDVKSIWKSWFLDGAQERRELRKEKKYFTVAADVVVGTVLLGLYSIGGVVEAPGIIVQNIKSGRR